MDIILSFFAKPVDKHGITLMHIIHPPLRYRADTADTGDDENGGGTRILESQPEYSQDAQRVDDELSASFDDSTNVRSKDFISGDT